MAPSGTLPEVLAALATLVLQAVVQAYHERLEVGVLQRVPHLCVAVLVERIQVHPQCAREQHWVLRIC